MGLSTGAIFYYKKRNMDSKLLVNPGKEHDIVELTSPQAHKVSPFQTNLSQPFGSICVSRVPFEN